MEFPRNPARPMCRILVRNLPSLTDAVITSRQTSLGDVRYTQGAQRVIKRALNTANTEEIIKNSQ